MALEVGTMKAGDRVLVTAVPGVLPENAQTKEIFARSVGRVFRVIEVRDDGQAELEVGEVVGEAAWAHTIWIEPECLQILEDHAGV